jgi:uncharacterized membrane protein YphA (DoxX/SURF4 family)
MKINLFRINKYFYLIHLYTQMNHLFFPAVLITLVFFLSGLEKIMYFAQTTQKFSKKLSVPLTLAQVAITGAIGLELSAPLVIAGYNFGGFAFLAPYYPIALLALILFTVVVTIMYHNPTECKENFYTFMSNISTIGGLLALYMLINTQINK